MQTISVNGIKRSIPQNWAELQQNKKMFLYVVSLFFKKLTKQQLWNLASYKFAKLSRIRIVRLHNIIFQEENTPQKQKISENPPFPPDFCPPFPQVSDLWLNKN